GDLLQRLQVVEVAGGPGSGRRVEQAHRPAQPDDVLDHAKDVPRRALRGGVDHQPEVDGELVELRRDPRVVEPGADGGDRLGLQLVATDPLLDPDGQATGRETEDLVDVGGDEAPGPRGDVEVC